VVIKPNANGRISLGSTVTFEMNGKEITYQILGVQEANPAHGKISHLSPLGQIMLGKAIGDNFLFNRNEITIQKIE